MSKHIARLVVTVLILGVLGYVGYTYFFQTDSNLHVYESTLSLSENLMGDDSLFTSFKKLRERDYFGTNKNNKITNAPNQKISYDARELFFNFENVEKDFEHKPVSYETGLFTLVNELNNATLTYLTHSKFAENVSDSHIKSFDNARKRVSSSANELKNDINNLLKRKENSSLTSATYNQVNTSYENLVKKTLTHVKLHSQFLEELKNFVVLKSYNGNFIYESLTILYNSIFYTAQNFDSEMSREDVIKLTYEIMLIKENFNDVYLSGDVDLVRYYNDIVAEQPNLLFGNSENNIFSFSYEDKLKLAKDGTYENKVPAKFADNIQYIFATLGY